ncbi:formin-like protein 11 [Lolium rigidum]|uniref:formin-like protein 11 n=1 Tax=Lolium rigidum TaxID=89674 RepID=UPI001F5D674B|nr:formin-like protein 11 [Lolium rigidum]
MRRCRRECLLAPWPCIISLLLIKPTVCQGLLVGASDMMSPPALTPPFIKQVDDWVEHAWLKCGLDKKSLQDVKTYFNYNHVLDILHRISDNKDTSPVIEQGTSPLTSEIKQTLLICLSKQSFEVTKNLPDGYIKTLIAAIRRDLTLGIIANQAVKPATGKPTDSVSSETAPAKKAVPATESAAKKDSDQGDGMSTTTIIASSTSSHVNQIDVNKLGALPLKSETGQNGYVDQSLHESADNDQNGYVKLSSQEVPHTGQNSHVDLNSQEGQNTGQNSHVKLGLQESANTDLAGYNSSSETMADSVNSVQGSIPVPQQAVSLPPMVPAPPKALPPPASQAPASPPKASPVPPSGPSPPPAPKASAVPPTGPSPPPAPKAAPPPPPSKSNGPPPPPSKSNGPPPPPLKSNGPRPPAMPGSSRPPPMKKSGNKADADADSSEAKTKLKPFFWDKVTANANQSMVWDNLKAGSFQFNENAIETLFGFNADKKSGDATKDLKTKKATQLVRILDPKKAQNLAISLKALSVSAQEVCCAVKEGNELPSDLIQTLIRWIPSSDEELRLRLYTGELSQLGPAEQFLKAIIDIPYIYQRLDALLFMSSLPEEASGVKQSFATLEVACDELRNSRLFLKLLEAVLKTGNRMNVGTFRGEAQAFKLDTLLKLSDVKGTDGKTTLLHFVVQEIIRSEGVRSARAAKEQTSSGSSTDDSAENTEDEYKQIGLQVVSSLGDELQNVRKAAILDADQLTMSVASLGHKLVKTSEFLNTSMKSLNEESGFHHKLVRFVEKSQADVTSLLEEEKKIRTLVKGTVDFFHGSTGKDEGLRLFVVVRDFLAMLDKVCREVKETSKVAAPKKTKPGGNLPSQPPKSFQDSRRNLFPAIQDRRADSSSSSSDDDS